MEDEIVYCDFCGAELENEFCDCGHDMELSAGEEFRDNYNMFYNEI